jgi:hypothetical protein
VIELDAAEIEVHVVPAPNRTAVDLRGAVRAWIDDHLRPLGATGRVRVSVNNAEILESAVSRTGYGGTSFERTRQFDGIVDVRLQATDRTARRAGFADATAMRTETAPADVDAYARQRLVEGMTDALLNDMHAQLQAEIPRRMADFVR